MPHQEVRVRFAPSPTGNFHIGNLRTALFNWLFARHAGGKLLVRIEDTDIARSREEFTAIILDTLAWCDIQSDEPICFQSQRSEIYAFWASELLTRNALYRCYCTQEEMRQRARGVSKTGDEYFFYDGLCRDRKEILDKPYVLRFRVPRDRTEVVIDDLLHGTLRFPLSAIDDFVVVRSDGSSMYNFTVVVDDALMKISHVLRGDDHIVNTPRQVLIYEAAGWAIPHFAHMPLILGKDGTKLSKRDAATSVIDYRRGGILAEALCNYLVRLGWASGDREIIARDELIKIFSLKNVGIKGAQFDYVKLLWMNSVYLKEMNAHDLMRRIENDVMPGFREKLNNFREEQIVCLIHLYQKRCKTLVELASSLVTLSYVPEIQPEERSLITSLHHDAARELIHWLASTTPITVDLIKQYVQTYTFERSISLADIAGPLRRALTGSSAAPSIAEIIMCLGREESIARLRKL